MARARLRNVARGGGKAFKGEVQGLKELEAKLKAMIPENPAMARFINAVVADAASATAGIMRTSASAAGWPASIVSTIFSYGKQRENSKKRISALAGVSKKRSMVVWRAGRHPKSANAKVPPGGKVAMARATMLEFGTSRSPAKPAIRNAVKQAKGVIIAKVTEGFQSIYSKFSKP